MNEIELLFANPVDVLQSTFDKYNADYFGGTLKRPKIELVADAGGAWLGCCFPWYGNNARTVICIDRKYLDYCHLPDKYAIVKAILLHEIVHQYLYEVKGQRVGEKHCHGKAFASLCNKVALRMEIKGCVKSERTWRKGKRGISCTQWPMCFMPDVESEMRPIERERIRTRKPEAPLANRTAVENAARGIETELRLARSPLIDRYDVVLRALGIKPESETMTQVIGSVLKQSLALSHKRE